MSYRSQLLISALLSYPLVGCTSSNGGPTGGAGAPTTQPGPTAGDPAVLGRNLPVVHLDVLQMSVPRGSISRSDEFWKHVDEERVDPATYDLLLKNGMRVGIAPTSDWAYFRDIIERSNARAHNGSVLAGGAGSLELSMKKQIRSQDIFYLNDENRLSGRTYEKCENLLGIHFWPEPRQPGALHVTVTPTVRATRARLEFKLNGEEREIVEVKPERLYDLNLTAVIPPDSFLVLAPSRLGRWPTSLGSTFLMAEGEAEMKEQVLVLVPKRVRFAPPVAAPQPVGPAAAMGR